MQAKIIFAGITLAMMTTILTPAYAQYDVIDNGIYKEMEKSKDKVAIATHADATGSGVPYFAADGVLGASILSAGVFGGVAALFFVRSKKGKYSAIGRG